MVSNDNQMAEVFQVFWSLFDIVGTKCQLAHVFTNLNTI